MKRKNKNYWLLGFLLLLGSCEFSGFPDEEPESSTAFDRQVVTFEALASDNVTLFIFRKSGDKFLYQTEIRSGWDSQGKIVRKMDPGTYQFLFVKTPWTGTVLSPDPLTTSINFNELKFNARTAEDKEGYVLPVDELFLPESASTADPMEIKGGETVTCRLKRAVCRANLRIKRGERQNNDFKPVPYSLGETVMDNITSVHLELNGIGTSANLNGTYGHGILSIDRAAASIDTLTAEGFAVFNIPFFFPPASTDKIIKAKVKIETETGILTSPIMEVIDVMRNQEVDITVWLPAEQPKNDVLIGITADTRPITEMQDGDIGFWE